MPSYDHLGRVRAQGYSDWASYTTTDSTGMFVYGNAEVMGKGKTVKSAILSSCAYTTYTGGSTAHNNLQPYITVYMWKRTA